MIINLQLYSILRDKLPKEAKGRTILHLEEDALISDILENFNITRNVVISLNGDHISDKDHPLKDGDNIKLFSSISGG